MEWKAEALIVLHATSTNLQFILLPHKNSSEEKNAWDPRTFRVEAGLIFLWQPRLRIFALENKRKKKDTRILRS
jgi:hypothetical protein